MQEFACSISRKDLQDLADLAMQVYRNPDELPFTYFRPIRDRLYFLGVRRHQGRTGSDVSRTWRLRFISNCP